MTTRRGVLMLMGGGVVLAAAAGGGFYIANEPSQVAREPWRDAGKPTEYRERFLSYALLAPNPHNRQPWLVRLDGEDGLTLFCDLDRRLPATDPPDRQITLGCGAFLELLSIAASSEGYRAEVTAFPDGEPTARLDARPIARVRFIPSAASKDPAFAYILTRTTNRNVTTDVVPSAADLDAMTAAGSGYGVQASATSMKSQVEALRDLTWRGYEREARTHAAHEETVNLMRMGKAEVEKWRDGVSLEGPMMEALKAVGVLNRETMRDPNSTAFKQGLDMYRAKAASAQAYGWLVSAGNTKTSQLNAGRAYARFDLKAAELGLAIHPWSASLQEYKEMADLYRETHEMLGGGGTVQMLVRLGYAQPVIHAPRRGVEALLKSEAGAA